MHKFLSLLLALSALAFASSPALAVYPEWDISGTWNADHHYNGHTYTHVNHVTEYITLTGAGLSGYGGWTGMVDGVASGSSNTWNITNMSDGPSYVTGNTIHMNYKYSSGENCKGYVDATINPLDGSLSGTWHDNCYGDRTGNWTTGAGVAKHTCQETGFYRDGKNLTAALINPPSPVSGPVNATGCNIGVYFNNGTNSINNADIFGSNYFGVLVNGDANNVTVNLTDSNVHNVGEVPFNGTQHGVAVYYRSVGTGSVTGEISGNTVTKYQKGGITANGNATVNVTNNVVTGEGPVAYIAQNGIQYGWGAMGHVQDNTVSRHSYSGSNYASDGGILVVGGPCYGGAYTKNVQIVKNTLTNNDVGVYLSNLDDNCAAPSVMTNIKVINNTISNDAITNKSGYTYPDIIGYQAGISDVGKNDKLINNKISGIGYSPETDNPYIRLIDASFTNAAKVHANKFQ